MQSFVFDRLNSHTWVYADEGDTCLLQSSQYIGSQVMHSTQNSLSFISSSHAHQDNQAIYIQTHIIHKHIYNRLTEFTSVSNTRKMWSTVAKWSSLWWIRPSLRSFPPPPTIRYIWHWTFTDYSSKFIDSRRKKNIQIHSQSHMDKRRKREPKRVR